MLRLTANNSYNINVNNGSTTPNHKIYWKKISVHFLFLTCDRTGQCARITRDFLRCYIFAFH